ncbi:MAG: hypothetical protein ABIA04_14075 [Pseudomonadota bacterium]
MNMGLKSSIFLISLSLLLIIFSYGTPSGCGGTYDEANDSRVLNTSEKTALDGNGADFDQGDYGKEVGEDGLVTSPDRLPENCEKYSIDSIQSKINEIASSTIDENQLYEYLFETLDYYGTNKRMPDNEEIIEKGLYFILHYAAQDLEEIGNITPLVGNLRDFISSIDNDPKNMDSFNSTTNSVDLEYSSDSSQSFSYYFDKSLVSPALEEKQGRAYLGVLIEGLSELEIKYEFEFSGQHYDSENNDTYYIDGEAELTLIPFESTPDEENRRINNVRYFSQTNRFSSKIISYLGEDLIAEKISFNISPGIVAELKLLAFDFTVDNGNTNDVHELLEKYNLLLEYAFNTNTSFDELFDNVKNNIDEFDYADELFSELLSEAALLKIQEDKPLAQMRNPYIRSINNDDTITICVEEMPEEIPTYNSR